MMGESEIQFEKLYRLNTWLQFSSAEREQRERESENFLLSSTALALQNCAAVNVI